MTEGLENGAATATHSGKLELARDLWVRRGCDFMTYGSRNLGCCQEKYIVGELTVRTDAEVIGRARVTRLEMTGGAR